MSSAIKRWLFRTLICAVVIGCSIVAGSLIICADSAGAAELSVDAVIAVTTANVAYAHALLSGDAPSFGALFDPQAIVVRRDGSQIQTRRAIESAARESFNRAIFRRADFQAATVRIDDGSMLEIGRYHLEIERNGSGVVAALGNVRSYDGTFVTVWHRVAGAWLIVLDVTQS